LSDIIKSNFISFSEQKKKIQNIDKDDPNVLKSTLSVGDSNQTFSESKTNRLSLDDLNLDGSQLAHGNSLDSVPDGTNTSKDVSLDDDSEMNDNSVNLISDEQLIQIEKIKEEARNEGNNEGFKSGKSEGYESGYNEGKQTAEAEVNLALINYNQQQEDAMETFKNQVIEEYSGYKIGLEPKMLLIIEDLVTKLIGVQKISKGTIMHLIKCGLDELELHGDLIIKVSSHDLDYVIERRGELTEELSEKIKVEILKDQQLEDGECIIETEMGTIDCSLGTQLDGLMKELKLIRESLLVD